MEVAVQTYWESTQQTAVVTGAAHPAGIGFGIAEALASCGMDVVIMDLPSTLLGESSAKLQENYGVRVLPVPIDITSDQDVEKAVEQIRRFTPTVHALVNNAGDNARRCPFGRDGRGDLVESAGYQSRRPVQNDPQTFTHDAAGKFHRQYRLPSRQTPVAGIQCLFSK